MKGREKRVAVKLVRKIHCEALGLGGDKDEEIVWSAKVDKEAGKSSKVAHRLKTLGKPLAGGYKSHFEKSISVSSYARSANLGGFTCQYELQVVSDKICQIPTPLNVCSAFKSVINFLRSHDRSTRLRYQKMKANILAMFMNLIA